MPYSLRPLLLAVLLAGSASAATTPSDKLDPITVIRVHDPAFMPYEKVYALASILRQSPFKQVQTRFRLMSMRPGDDMKNVNLALFSKSIDLPINVGPDGYFDAPLDPRALAEEAEFVTARPVGTLRWLFYLLLTPSTSNTYTLSHLRAAASEADEAVKLLPWWARLRLAFKSTDGVVFEFPDNSSGSVLVEDPKGSSTRLVAQEGKVKLSFRQFDQLKEAKITPNPRPVAIHPDMN